MVIIFVVLRLGICLVFLIFIECYNVVVFVFLGVLVSCWVSIVCLVFSIFSVNG